MPKGFLCADGRRCGYSLGAMPASGVELCVYLCKRLSNTCVGIFYSDYEGLCIALSPDPNNGVYWCVDDDYIYMELQ